MTHLMVFYGLNCKKTIDNSKVFACCCYLPPNYSTRQVDAHEFFDTLLSSIYKYQDEGLLFICGDFNSRCSNTADYIVGVDKYQNAMLSTFHVIGIEIFVDF